MNILKLGSAYLLIVLLGEVLAFSGFAYFVFTKTTGEVCRRWKASVVCGVVVGFCIHSFFFVLGIIGLLVQINLNNLPGLIASSLLLIPAYLGVDSYITMPMVILGTFIAYSRFEQYGDRLIEKYWRNPKVHYGKDQKPPFLKF